MLLNFRSQSIQHLLRGIYKSGIDIGHPVVGDVQYAANNMKKKTRLLAPRHLLHAASITFSIFGRKYSFSAAIPDDFEAFVRSIDENKQS